MNARNDVKRLFEQSFERAWGAKRVLAAVQLRLVARVDDLVARWLARCAANIEVAQHVFPDRGDTGLRDGLLSAAR